MNEEDIFNDDWDSKPVILPPDKSNPFPFGETLDLHKCFTEKAPSRNALVRIEGDYDPENSEADDFESAIMPRGEVCMLVAAGAVGKSTIALSLIEAVASGSWWLKHEWKVTPGKAIGLFTEDPINELHRRFRRVCDESSEPSADGSITTPTFHTQPLIQSLTGDSRITFIDDDGKTTVNFDKVYDWLKRGHEKTKDLALIVLDPLIRFAGPNAETDNAAATNLISHAEKLTGLPGNPTVLLLAHTNKDSRESASGVNAARGSGAFTDGARWVANLSKSINENRVNFIGPVKYNNGKPWRFKAPEKDQAAEFEIVFGHGKPELKKALQSASPKPVNSASKPTNPWAY